MLLTAQRSEEMKARILASVEAALRARGISARRASLDVVGHDGLIRDIRAGRLPGVDRLAALFDYLGIEFRIGPPPSQPGFAEPAASFVPQGRADHVPIPWHPQAAPQGGPGPVAFTRGWLERAGLDPARLAAICAGLPPAEVLALVEPMALRRGGPALWGLRQNGRLRLALVQFDPAATVVFAAEPGGPAQILTGGDRARLQILGRVLWSGRREGC